MTDITAITRKYHRFGIAIAASIAALVCTIMSKGSFVFIAAGIIILTAMIFYRMQLHSQVHLLQYEAGVRDREDSTPAIAPATQSQTAQMLLAGSLVATGFAVIWAINDNKNALISAGVTIITMTLLFLLADTIAWMSDRLQAEKKRLNEVREAPAVMRSWSTSFSVLVWFSAAAAIANLMLTNTTPDILVLTGVLNAALVGGIYYIGRRVFRFAKSHVLHEDNIRF